MNMHNKYINFKLYCCVPWQLTVMIFPKTNLIKLFVSFQALLSIDDDTDNPDDNVFYQVQSLFGHLMESKLQYYVPENFWKVLHLFFF